MKNKFSKWDVGGGSRSIIQGLNLFTSRNLFKSLKSILMVVALLSLSSNVWGAEAVGKFTLVTNAATLSAGDEIIIVAKDYAYALSTTQNTNNRGQASVTKSGNDITLTSGSNVQSITLSEKNSHFEFGTGNGYLYAASSSSNYLKTQNTNNANGEWTISISSGTATITAQGTNSRNVMQYNQSSSIFACYGSASQKAICVYKKAASTYTVNFNANGGSVSPSSATQASAGASISLPTPTRDCYRCTGWYTATSGGTKRGDAGGSYVPTATETIYAQWTSSKLATPTNLRSTNITQTEATLSWNAVTNASSYDVFVTDGDAEYSYNVSSTSKTVTGLTAGKYYMWTVKAKGTGVYCVSDEAEGEFTTEAGPSTPDYYFRGKHNDWGAAKMTAHESGYYAYYGPVSGDQRFKIAKSESGWDYTYDKLSAGFQYTNITNMGQWDQDGNCGIYDGNNYYILIYFPSTDVNGETDPKICASSELPNYAKSGKTVYFDNSLYGSSTPYLRMGRNNHSSNNAMTKVTGTANLYKFTTTGTTNFYENYSAYTVANAQGSSSNIYDLGSVTKTTVHAKKDINKDITIVPTGGETYYNYNESDGMLTHNVSIGSHTNGTIKYSYTDVNGTAHNDQTSGASNLAHTCNLTITATPNTGYQLTSLTVNGNAFTSGSVHILSADATIAATFSVASYNVTLNTNGGTIKSGNVTSYTYGVGATLPTQVEKSGYTFGGWFDNSDCTGTAVTKIANNATGDKQFWAKWIQNVTVTFKNNGETTGAPAAIQLAPGSTLGSNLPGVGSMTAPISGYTFVGWVNHSDVWSGFEANLTQTLITGNETINADVTYDAVWAKAYNDYGRVIDGEEITTGKYLFTSNGDYALDNNFTTGTTAGKSITDEDGWVYGITDATILWVITAKDGTYSFYNAAKGKYLNTVSGSANLTLQDSPAWFTLTRTKDDYNNSLFDFACNGRHLEYWSNKFDTDGSKMYGTIMLYKQDATNFFVTPPAQITVTWHIGNGTQTATTYDGTAFSDVEAPSVADDAIGDCVDKFMGWATAAITKDEAEESDVQWANETTISNSNKDFYAVFAQAEGSGEKCFEKVSSAPADWCGKYLIVYETGNLAMDGSLATLDAVSNTKAVTISNNKIAYSKDMEDISFTVAYKTGSSTVYSLKSASGKYISGTTTSAQASNGIKQADTDTDYEISFDGLTIESKSSDQQMVMKYNDASDQKRFRFYKSGQKDVALYKLIGGASYSNYVTSCPDLKYATIHFDANGKTLASGSMPEDITNAIVGRANILPECSATVTGYTFAGWSESTTGSVITQYTPVAEGETYTLYAIWTPKTVTITWNANGGSVSPTSSSYTYDGASVELPTPTTTQEKKFVGWFTAATGGTQITEIGTTNKPDANVTYFAQWADIVWTDYLTDCGTSYNITLADDGTKTGGNTFSTSPAGTAMGGSEVTLTANPNSCYTFTSWSVYKTGDQSTTVAVDGNTFEMPEYDVTVDATFTQIDYVISYDRQGGAAPQGSSETYGNVNVGCGNTWTAPVDPVKSGYTFQGWLGAESATLYKQGQGFTPTQTQTMVAQWTANPYVWTLYNNQSGEWADAAIADVTSGSVVFNFTEKEQQFAFKIRKTNDGVNYTYYGASGEDNEYTYAESLDDEHKYWTLNGNAGGYDVNVTTAAKGTYTIHISMDGDNPRIYIEYPTPYTIHFDGKGADYGSMADIVNIASGENVVLPANGFTKTNNAFVGWDTNSAGTSVVYGDQATINNVSADITLYAVWVSARYTITLDANGGEVSPDRVQQAVVGGTVALPTPTRDGYAFDGWYTEREGGSKITEAYPIPLADATYYAHWTSLETTWYLKGDFDWTNGVQFVKMPGQSSDVAFAIVEWNSDDNMNFKIYDSAEDKWYGNEGTMTRTNCTGWNVWNDNNNNTKLTPTGHGHYIFKLDLSGEYPAISVSYPNWNYDSHNSTAGTRGQGNFTYVNPLDWKYEGFILPTIDNGSDEGKQIWIGDGEWNNNYSENWWYRWIKLNQYADETVGHGVDGAVGTLHINPFSGSKNYGLRFDPAGYGMKYGSGSGAGDMTDGYLAFTQKTNDPAVWNTQAIENIEDYKGKQFYVGLATATEGDYKFSYDFEGECNGLSAIANINDVKVWTEANPDRWGDATVGSLSNTRGHFQIWADNASQKNFYIHWIPDNKMTFDLGDAEGHVAAIDPMYRGRDLSGSEATITLPEPADWISHTFDGWVINGVQHNAGDEILLNEDMTAVAQWTTNYYTITYTGISAYSTTCDGSTSVLCGTAQTVCMPSEATGYEFSGWTSDVPLDGETEFVGGENFTMPCENVTFTGSYTPIVYNITYEGLEGATHTNPATYTIEDEITFTNPTARAGYEFLGWFDAETDGNPVTGITLGSMGDVIVWAHWTANSYSVTLNKNTEDVGSTDGSATFVYNTSAPTSYVAATRNGYDLNGYWTTAGGGTKVLDNSGTVTAGNSAGWKTDGKWTRANNDGTLYAHWTAKSDITYTVNHYQMDPDGVNYTLKDHSGGTGSTGQDKSSYAQPNNYEGFVTPEAQTLILTWPGPCVVDYYYARNKYELTWAGLEDATVTGDYTQGQVYHGADITYPTSVSKDGYCFKGWDPKPTTMPIGATTITAQWAAYENYRTYCGDAVTFKAQNGTEPEEEYVITTDNGKITTPTLVETGFTQPEGWVLIGWTKVGGDPQVIVEPSEANVAVEDGDEYNAVWTHITITGNVLTTSAVGVQVGTTIHVEGTTNKAYGLRVSFVDTKGTDDPSDDVTYGSATGQTAVTQSDFRLADTDYNFVDDRIIQISGAAAGATHSSDYNVVYTPRTANEIDNYVLQIQVMKTSQTALDGAVYTLNLKGRALPDNFVIAEYLNGTWYALPANMSTSTTYAGIPITVEEEGMDRVVTNATLDMVYSMKTYNFDKSHVLFQSQFNQGHLRAAATDGTGISNDAKTISGENKPYSWMPMPQDATLDTYVMSNVYNNKTLVLNSEFKFGMYAKASTNTNIVYFIPLKAEEYVEKEMMMVEWFPTKVLVEVEEDALTGVRAKINNVEVADVAASDVTYGTHLYEITGLNTLVDNAANKLTILYTKEETTYGHEFDIPVIVSNKTYILSSSKAENKFPWTQAIYNTADLVVRDNSVLTVDGATATANTFGKVTIYPTSKVVVPAQTAGDNATDITMTTTTMTLFGGTDEIYDGSEYTMTKYGVPQLVLNGKLVHNETTSGLVYDVRLDAAQYYNFALPYTSKYELVTDNKGGEDFTFWTKIYNGAARAAGGTGWDWYDWDADPWAINIGTGYMFAAQPYAGQNYIIIRHPMGYSETGDKYAQNTDGHQSGTAEATKAAVDVYAHPSKYDNNAGWNYIANPFMAKFTKDQEGTATGTIQTGKLVEHKVNDKWDGHYEWEAGSMTVRYVTLYNNGSDTYTQLPMSEAELPPFTGFFVQIAKNGQIVFDISGRTNEAPARMLSEDELPSEMEIFLHATCQGQKDDAVLFINDELHRDNAKEFPNEMTKQENANTLNFYTFGGDDIKMYANGMSYEDAQGWSKAGVKVATAGEYTFSVASDKADYIQQVILKDMDSNTEYDLMSNDAKIYLDKGEMNDRFYVKIVFGKHNIGTGVTERYDTSGPEKFILNDHMYIRANGVLFDGVGKRVKY